MKFSKFIHVKRFLTKIGRVQKSMIPACPGLLCFFFFTREISDWLFLQKNCAWSVDDCMFCLFVSRLTSWIFKNLGFHDLCLRHGLAFDRVWYAALWAAIKKYNISTNLIQVIKNLYNKATSAVLFNSSIGDWFQTTVGVPSSTYFWKGSWQTP